MSPISIDPILVSWKKNKLEDIAYLTDPSAGSNIKDSKRFGFVDWR